MKFRLVFGILTFGFLGCNTTITVIDKPIIFDEQRIQLTKEYLQSRYQLSRESITIIPKMIVLHHTVISTFANIKLVNYLASKYPIEYLIGHHEYTRFEGHELWLEVDAGYRTKKDDPGASFMLKVRKATRKNNFKPLPKK